VLVAITVLDQLARAVSHLLLDADQAAGVEHRARLEGLQRQRAWACRLGAGIWATWSCRRSCCPCRAPGRRPGQRALPFEPGGDRVIGQLAWL
jgi:hypothetical protein